MSDTNLMDEFFETHHYNESQDWQHTTQTDTDVDDDPLPEDLTAVDKDPLAAVNAIIKRIGRQWTKAFDKMSTTVASAFADQSRKHHDTLFQNNLRKAGFTVNFQTTPQVRRDLDGIIKENVDLIKSIPVEHLERVAAHVKKSVLAGRKLDELTDLLVNDFGVTRRRAQLIARDQNNKATAHIQRTRQNELGITHALWSHTQASKEPREEHEEWNGEKYPIDEGMYSEVEGEQQWPGTAINCGCTSRSIIPGFDDDEEE